MKNYPKLALLVVMVLFLSLSACTLKASTPQAATKAPTGEAAFPTTTQGGGLATFGTQTALAQTPGAAGTAQVVVSTETPSGATEAGGGQAATATPQPSGQGQGQTPPQTQPQSQPPVNTPVVNRPPTYTLQKGEWPICIARRYNLDLGQFFALNGMNMNSRPGVGTVVKIPSGGTWSANYGNRALRAHPTSYTVTSGETVNSIACLYGDVTPDGILAVNGISANDIKPGLKLQIP